MVRADVKVRTAGPFSAAAPVGEAVVSLDGRFLEVNPALCEIIGHTEVELSAMNAQEITHPDDVEAERELMRQLLTGEIRGYQIEKRVLRKNGEIGWVLVSVSLVRSDAGEPSHFASQVKATANPRNQETRA